MSAPRTLPRSASSRHRASAHPPQATPYRGSRTSPRIPAWGALNGATAS